MRLVALAFALSLGVACTEGLKGQYFQKGDLKYRVAELDRNVWKRVGFENNDLAWVSTSGAVLAMNATCKDYGDPSLEVLTNHLLMGFTDKELVERKTFVLDGRDALESTYAAKLDGVPMKLTVAVLKKDGCVHDFTYVAPEGEAAKYRAQLDVLLDGFTTTEGRPQGRTATVRLGVPEVRPEEEPEPPQEAKAP